MIDKDLLEYLETQTLTETEYKQIFDGLAQIENIDSFFKLILKKDMVQFFNTQPDQQQLVRGAYMRTKWLLSEIQKSRITPEEALKKFNIKKKTLTKKR